MIRGLHHLRRRCAFTLVELLVVLAVIGVLLTTVLTAWARSDQGRALRAAEAAVSGALAAARSHAVLAQADVVLVVDATNPAAESYLRSIRLYCVEPAPQGMWLKASVLLPPMVRVVPPLELGLPGITFAPDWPASLGSTALLTTDAVLPPGYLRLARFTSTGRTTLGSGGWVLAVAERQGDVWRFQNASIAREVVLSRYGVATPAGGAGGHTP